MTTAASIQALVFISVIMSCCGLQDLRPPLMRSSSVSKSRDIGTLQGSGAMASVIGARASLFTTSGHKSSIQVGGSGATEASEADVASAMHARSHRNGKQDSLDQSVEGKVGCNNVDAAPPIYYKICHGHSGALGSGKCLQDDGGLLKQNHDAAHTWTFTNVETVDGTIYHTIKSNRPVGRYLNYGGNTLQVVDLEDGDQTKWEIIQDGSYVRLRNKAAQNYLEGHLANPSVYASEHNDGLWSVLPQMSSSAGVLLQKGEQDEETKNNNGEKDDDGRYSTTMRNVPPDLYFKVCRANSAEVGTGCCLEDSAGVLTSHTGSVAETFKFDMVLADVAGAGVKWHTIKSHGIDGINGKYLKGGTSDTSPTFADADVGDSTKWQIVWDGPYLRFYSKESNRWLEGHTESPTFKNLQHPDGLWTALPLTSSNGFL